jgi:predicted phage-related endonuclease
MTAVELGFRQPIGRRGFIGGSDARIVMGNDEAALVRLWREKRGEAEPDLLNSLSRLIINQSLIVVNSDRLGKISSL